MFLQCRKQVMKIPESSESSLVFKFNNLKCGFFPNFRSNGGALTPRMPSESVQKSLEKINLACNGFNKLKILRNLFFVSILLIVCGVFTGAIFINIGVAKTEPTVNEFQIIRDTTKIIQFSNAKIIAGACIICTSLLLFVIFQLLIICYARRLRDCYESAVFAVVNELNDEIKHLGIRWKIGLYLRWVEISFDYKKKDDIGEKSGSQYISSIGVLHEVKADLLQVEAAELWNLSISKISIKIFLRFNILVDNRFKNFISASTYLFIILFAHIYYDKTIY